MYQCPICRGTGALPDSSLCRICLGHGVMISVWSVCPRCDGDGGTVENPQSCRRCGGKGRIPLPKPFTDPIPDPILVAELQEIVTTLAHGEPVSAPERLQGVVIGFVTLMSEQTEQTGNAYGQQLRTIMRQGGDLIFAHDGVWHRVDGLPPARVYRYSVETGVEEDSQSTSPTG